MAKFQSNSDSHGEIHLSGRDHLVCYVTFFVFISSQYLMMSRRYISHFRFNLLPFVHMQMTVILASFLGSVDQREFLFLIIITYLSAVFSYLCLFVCFNYFRNLKTPVSTITPILNIKSTCVAVFGVNRTDRRTDIYSQVDYLIS